MTNHESLVLAFHATGAAERRPVLNRINEATKILLSTAAAPLRETQMITLKLINDESLFFFTGCHTDDL